MDKVALAIKALEKKYGVNSVTTLSEAAIDVTTFSSGSLLLDQALGVDGYPEGRIIEIYGPESSGKTTLTLHAIAEAQKLGKLCAFVDAEHALDPLYAAKLGVDVEKLLLSQPSSGEEALDIVEVLVRTGEVGVIVVDSVAALTPKAELEGDMSDSNIALQARMLSKAMRKITGAVSKTGCTVFFINQLREKVGVMFGSPETTSGGRALKFYASVRLDIRRTSTIKGAEGAVGNNVRIKVVKNKVAPPFKECETEIEYNVGISKVGEILDLGIELGIIDKAGAWFTIEDQRLQGRSNAKAYLKDNPKVTETLTDQIKELI